MKKVCFYILILFSLFQAQDFIPENGKVVNYTQLFFRWPQINNAELYTINLNSNNYEQIYEAHGNSIIISDFDWGTEYSWLVCGYDNNSLIECYDFLFFSTNQLPENYPDNVNIMSSDYSQYSPGITMLDYESLDFSVALDFNGTPVWFADKTVFDNSSLLGRIIVTQFLSTGNIVGFGTGIGYEFDLDSEIIFETPDDLGVHHQIHKTSNDTYFFIDAEVQNNLCPIECDEDFPNEIPWQGDTFVEVDNQGNIIWEWSTFDYLSLNEYNPLWVENYSGFGNFDWTHSNSVFLDEISDIVYVSIRNLSRITAIDYFSKGILWNLGDSDFMDEVFFESDYGFSHQHSAQIADNNNLIFFDNGRNNNPEVSRCVELNLDQEPIIIWEYILPDSLLTLSRGECDRLENHNTLISIGRTGNVIEVNSDNEIVWHLNVKDINGNEISIYRSERIINLYPSAFSFKVNNLGGAYGEYYLLNNDENIQFVIENNGWISQAFKYEFYNEDNIFLFGDEIFVESNNNIDVIEYVTLNGVEACMLKVFPVNNSDNYQSITFDMQQITGDINNDLQVNVLDVVILINNILYNVEFNQNADLNGDTIINILDIVMLINIILGID